MPRSDSSNSESRIRRHTLSCARPRHCWPQAASAGGGATARSADRTALALGAEPLRADIAGLARRARLKLVAPRRGTADVDGGRAGLTSREEDVLRLLADGLTNREIGRRLFISQKTVGTHVAHIFEKLDVHTRLEAAGRAQQLGVLERSR